MALLSVKNLSVGYDRSPVASGISFDVGEGEFLLIVGENGSGKSTLMKTVLGLMSPVSGEIAFGDGLKSNEIGYLGQQTAVQKDFPASVMEIVLSGCLNRCGRRPFFGKKEKALAKANMEITGVLDLKDRSYRTLSGGQQQRVLLARALCASSRLLFLDEPVTGLDPDAASEMYRTVADLKKRGTAVVMISHDIGPGLELADRILHLGDEVRLMSVQEYAQVYGGRS